MDAGLDYWGYQDKLGGHRSNLHVQTVEGHTERAELLLGKVMNSSVESLEQYSATSLELIILRSKLIIKKNITAFFLVS